LKKSLYLLFLGIVIASFTAPQKLSAGDLQARQYVAKELVEILKKGGVYDAIMDNAIKITPEVARENIRILLKEKLDNKLLIQEWEKIIVDIYNLKEKKAMLSFYQTETGMSILLKRPVVNVKMNQAFKKILQKSLQ